MKHQELQQHLSKISTMWTMLQQAHKGSEEEKTAAQKLLLERYGGAVHRYLVRLLGDPHTADDLFQEFALALIQGSLRGADPQRQRFRFYVKTVLFHLVTKHRKRQQKQLVPLPGDSPELAALAALPEDSDREFNEHWREQLLARTWEALSQAQPAFYEVLRFRAEHPKMPSEEMAKQLAGPLGKTLTPDGVRQTLRRAREKFADLLLDEIAPSLEDPTIERVEEELAALNLLDYCRPALKRRSDARAEE